MKKQSIYSKFLKEKIFGCEEEKDAFRNNKLHETNCIWGFFYRITKIQYKKTIKFAFL